MQSFLSYMKQHNYKALLTTLVDVLRTQGMEAAGSADALQAYAALLALRNEAIAFDIPLADIGLADFDLDALLGVQTQTA
jgi:hypothetical protein